jgi:hypothetical protein
MADQADNARESDGLGAGDKVFPPNLGVQMAGQRQSYRHKLVDSHQE